MKSWIHWFLARFKPLLAGLVYALKDCSIALHLLTSWMVLILGLLLHLSLFEWFGLLVCCVAVVFAETLNTVIETLVDDIGLERRPLAKKAKDLAALLVGYVSFVALVYALFLIIERMI